MRPPIWNPPIELSASEKKVAQRIRKAKLFLFLREIRHELFDAEFQIELAKIFKDSSVGLCPVPPAQIALAIIIQAYTGVSDDEAIEAMVMDRRWQLVLDCLDSEQAPFGKGTLVRFRAALIATEGDRMLIERTIFMAQLRQGFSSRTLRAALDSSPLWGAARVEDTYNLLGHALRKALDVIAREQKQDLSTIASQAGADIVAGSSLKAALDLDWDDPQQRTQALTTILATINHVESWLQEQNDVGELALNQAKQGIESARVIEAQDTESEPDGAPKLRKGVAANRRISIEDQDMRHGRKSRNQRFNGYKRHVLNDVDLGMVRAVGVTSANQPEAEVTPAIVMDLQHQKVKLEELLIDRAYLTSHIVKERDSDLTIICKSWRVRNGNFFEKTAFTLDWDNSLIICPNGISLPFTQGQVVHFPKHQCNICPLRSQCTNSQNGRNVSIHADELLLKELRERQNTPQGREKLRERVSVEHCLAKIGQWQGEQARYIGLRKNLFDLRRMAIVHNLHVLAQMPITNSLGLTS